MPEQHLVRVTSLLFVVKGDDKEGFIYPTLIRGQEADALFNLVSSGVKLSHQRS
jgi:hypothetical protein